MLFDDKWYDIKDVKDFQNEIKKVTNISKSQEEINLSKAHKPNNSPWRKGLPQMPSREASAYAYFHGC